MCLRVIACVYRLRCSSRVRKVIRLGSGRERRRCIIQFSLAAGSESATRERKKMSDPIMARQLFNFSPYLFQMGRFNSIVKNGVLKRNPNFRD